MIRKLLCIAAVLALLPLGFAQAGPENWMVDENGLKLFFKHRSEWTFVTADTVEEHMELCTSRGYTEQAVRERFASGRVVWEAYHKRIPDGLVRYEVWSDVQTRNVWDLNQLSTKERNTWLEELADTWSTGKYAFVHPSYQSSGKEKHIVLTGVIQNPPAAYESGYGSLFIRNGQAMLLCYLQTTDRASKKSYAKQTYDFVLSETGITDWYQALFVPELLPEAVDLTAADVMIVNEHTGDITFRGESEKGAVITAKWGNYSRQATAGSDGAFTVAVPVTVEGNMAVALTAAKNGCSDNAAAISVPVDNGMARLTLTEYPKTTVDDQPITISGVAAPGAVVFITRGDEDPIMLLADGSDGTFTHTFEDVEDFVPQTVTITANEEGLRDAAVTLPFVRTYVEDISKGISKFKAKTISLSSAKLAANPKDYTGEFIRMEFRTTGVTRDADGLTLEADSMDSSKRRPMILKANDYLDDVIVSGMNITVYGIVEGVDADTELPVIRLVYVTYLKVTYR